MKQSELARIIDHTALRQETTKDRIIKLCGEAREFGFGAVCVAPVWIPLVVEMLSGTDIKIATVIGFPHGNTLTEVKEYEAEKAIGAGAHEFDMVINVGALKSGDRETVLNDIRSVVQVAHKKGALVKVILETALLTDDEKVLGCRLAEEAGADYVKTSTGFASGGSTKEDVALLRQTVGDRLGVKAAGGIRDLPTALAMIEAGATRLGCSASVSIMKELDRERKR